MGNRKEINFRIPFKVYDKGLKDNYYLTNYFFVLIKRNQHDVLIFTKKELFTFYNVIRDSTKKKVENKFEEFLNEFTDEENNIKLSNYSLNDIIMVSMDFHDFNLKNHFFMITNYEWKKFYNYNGGTSITKLFMIFSTHKKNMIKRDSNHTHTVEKYPEFSYFYISKLAKTLDYSQNTIKKCLEILEENKLIKVAKDKDRVNDGWFIKGNTIVVDYYSKDEETTSDIEIEYAKKYLERKFTKNKGGMNY